MNDPAEQTASIFGLCAVYQVEGSSKRVCGEESGKGNCMCMRPRETMCRNVLPKREPCHSC